MPNLLFRTLLFLSSYFPLAAIFTIQFYYKQQIWAAIAAASIGVVGLIGLAVYLRVARNINPLDVQISTVAKRDGEAMSYIVTYLLPFIALPSGNVADCISLGVFVALVAILYINSDMLHINPILNLLGWHIYEIELTNGEARILISHKRVRKAHRAKVAEIAEDVYLEVEK